MLLVPVCSLSLSLSLSLFALFSSRYPAFPPLLSFLRFIFSLIFYFILIFVYFVDTVLQGKGQPVQTAPYLELLVICASSRQRIVSSHGQGAWSLSFVGSHSGSLAAWRLGESGCLRQNGQTKIIKHLNTLPSGPVKPPCSGHDQIPFPGTDVAPIPFSFVLF